MTKDSDLIKSHAYIVTKYGIELSKHTEDKVELIVACLLHDLGNSYCSLRKIPESEIEQKQTEEERKLYNQLLIGQRLGHEKWGVEKAINILEQLELNPPFILDVVKLIINHDDWKFIEVELSDINAILLREADILWMLTMDGIQADINRAVKNGLKPMTIKEQWDWNYNLVGRHIKYGKDIVERNKKEIFG